MHRVNILHCCKAEWYIVSCDLPQAIRLIQISRIYAFFTDLRFVAAMEVQFDLCRSCTGPLCPLLLHIHKGRCAGLRLCCNVVLPACILRHFCVGPYPKIRNQTNTDLARQIRMCKRKGFSGFREEKGDRYQNELQRLRGIAVCTERNILQFIIAIAVTAFQLLASFLRKRYRRYDLAGIQLAQTAFKMQLFPRCLPGVSLYRIAQTTAAAIRNIRKEQRLRQQIWHRAGVTCPVQIRRITGAEICCCICHKRQLVLGDIRLDHIIQLNLNGSPVQRKTDSRSCGQCRVEHSHRRSAVVDLKPVGKTIQHIRIAMQCFKRILPALMHIFTSCGVKPGDPVSPRIGLIPLHRAETHFQIVQRYILSIDFQVEHSTRRNVVCPACHPAVLVVHIFQREIYCAVKRFIFKLFVDQFNLQSIHRIDIAQCNQCTQAQPFVIFCCTDRIIVGKSLQISFSIVRLLLQFFIDLLDGCCKAGNIT